MATATHTASEVARYVICYSLRNAHKKPVSNLQLQKILFFIQRQYCAANAGEMLFDEDFQAWKYGPVIPAVYYQYSAWGGLPISRCDDSLLDLAQLFTDEERELINSVIDRCVSMDPWDLVAESHLANTSWHKTYASGEGLRKVIDKALIREDALKYGR